MSALLVAAEKLTRRLLILKKLQAQGREQGRATVELDINELFESGDQEALDAWEQALTEHTGRQPLPFEVSA